MRWTPLRAPYLQQSTRSIVYIKQLSLVKRTHNTYLPKQRRYFISSCTFFPLSTIRVLSLKKDKYCNYYHYYCHYCYCYCYYHLSIRNVSLLSFTSVKQEQFLSFICFSKRLWENVPLKKKKDNYFTNKWNKILKAFLRGILTYCWNYTQCVKICIINVTRWLLKGLKQKE